MAKQSRQQVFGGDKDPIDIVGESAVVAEKRLLSFLAVIEKLSAELAGIQKYAKSMSGLTSISTGSNLGDLEKSNSLHKQAITILEQETQKRKELKRVEDEAAKAAADNVRAYERLTAEIAKREAKEAAAFAKREAQYNKEIAQNNKVLDSYQKVNQKLNQLTAEYRGLAVRKELGIRLTAEESKRYDFLQQKITKYDTALKAADASMGRHQRNVGNYSSAFNGLGNSVNQLTREMPAFANSFQTGFLAISNNLPMFFDEISKIKKANVDLAASGQPTTSVFKQLGGAIFSVSSLLSIGVTLLTIYGAELIKWASSELFVTDAMRKKKKALEEKEALEKRANEETAKAAKFIGQESKEYVGYLLQLKATNAGSQERVKLIKEINDKYHVTLKNLRDEQKFQSMINKEIENYLTYQKAKYTIQKNEELIAANLEKQHKLEIQLIQSTQKRTEALRRLNEERAKFQPRISLEGEATPVFRTATPEQMESTLRKFQDEFNAAEGEVVGLNRELLEADERLEKYGFNLLNASQTADKFGYEQEKAKKKTKELTIALKEFDDELQRRLNLGEEELRIRQRINEIDQDERIGIVSRLAEQELQNQREFAEQTGAIFVDTLESLIDEEFKLRKDAMEQRFYFQVQEVKRGFEAERILAIEALTKERDELLKQEGLTANARTAINTDYQNKLQQLSNNYLESERIMLLEIEKMTLEHQAALGELDREKVDRLNEVNTELIDLQKKYTDDSNKLNSDMLKKQADDAKKAADAEKKRQKELADLRKKSINEILKEEKRASEEREKQIDSEIAASQKLEDQLAKAAEAGTDSAKESLAAQREVTAQKLDQKREEQRRQEAIARIQAGYEIFEAFLSRGDSVPAATTKTGVALNVLRRLFGSGFFEGTDDTGKKGALRDQHGTITGYTHENELVMSKADRAKTGNKTRQQLIEASHWYDTFRVNDMLRNNAIEQSVNRTDVTHSPILAAQLKKLDVIANKLDNIPTEFFDQQTIDGVLHAVHIRKTGNETRRTFNKV